MKKALKYIGIALGVFILIAGIWVTDNFIYPFKADTPNYSDVEKAFAKLQFPADWKEISSSENKGLHGRGCDPLNDAGCFHKSKTFSVPDNLTVDEIKKVLSEGGCPGITTIPGGYKSDVKPSFDFSCGTTLGVEYVASLDGPKAQLYVGTNTY